MKPVVKRMDVFRVHIPFKVRFRHSRAEHRHTENIVVRLTLADGTQGYGECVPRAYVTSETPESVMAWLAGFRPMRLDPPPRALGDTIAFAREWAASSHTHLSNAARCALELALLDAYGKRQRFALSAVCRRVLGAAQTHAAPTRVRYSAPISACAPLAQLALGAGFRIWGFRHIKIKVGFDGRREIRALARLKRILGGKIALRVDANGAWTADEALTQMTALRKIGVCAVEDPVDGPELDALAELREKTRLPVILDESMRSLEDARQIADKGLADILNIRISKVGGLLPALDIARFAGQRGLGFCLGCQVGETGILSAAGRHFANTVKGTLHTEGSYDNWLLRKNLAKDGLRIPFGGYGAPLKGFGLGIDIDKNALDNLAVDRASVDF